MTYPQELPLPEQMDEKWKAYFIKQGLVRDDGEGTHMRPDEIWKIAPQICLAASLAPEQAAIHQRLGSAPPIGILKSGHYQVAIYEAHTPDGFPRMVHLSIKRRDRQPIDHNRWRILQRFKNICVGPEHEGVELYPAETRLVDTSNQYHVFVLVDDQTRFPFGFNERLVANKSTHGAVQREGTNYVDAKDKEVGEQLDSVGVTNG